MTTQEQVQEYLEGFQSPEDIASTCEREGITGIRQECLECVVARLLLKKFPEVRRVKILPDCFHQITLYPIEGRLILPLPDHINTFARDFDKGDYPHLETP